MKLRHQTRTLWSGREKRREVATLRAAILVFAHGQKQSRDGSQLATGAKNPLVRFAASCSVSVEHKISNLNILQSCSDGETTFLYIYLFFFSFFFSHPIHHLRTSSSSLSFQLVTQIQGHIAGSSPPFPLNRVVCLQHGLAVLKGREAAARYQFGV